MSDVFQTWPRADQDTVRLEPGQPSDLVPIEVGADASEVYLRLVMIWNGDEPRLSNRPPSIDLKAGWGPMTAVPIGSTEVPIIEDEESGAVIGKASAAREPRDVYFVKIAISDQNSRMWRIQITNNESVPMDFLWIASQDDDYTRQPRMLMKNAFDVNQDGRTDVTSIVVRVVNAGTDVLTITEQVDTDLGGGFILRKKPNPIRPNASGNLEIEVHQSFSLSLGGDRADHVLQCNVRDVENKTLHLVRNRKTTVEKTRKDHKDGGKDVLKEKESGPDKTRLDMMVPDLGGVNRLAERLADLQRTVGELGHFITAELRPDLSMSALSDEPDDDDVVGRLASIERRVEGIVRRVAADRGGDADHLKQYWVGGPHGDPTT